MDHLTDSVQTVYFVKMRILLAPMASVNATMDTEILMEIVVKVIIIIMTMIT